MKEPHELLDTRILKWIGRQGWKDLRKIQKEAVIPVLERKQDLLISASTASGKTEAAFLPACSAIAGQEEGYGIIYISPLKALINDQKRRLDGICNDLPIDVTPWHGDVPHSVKRKSLNNPKGILLITPESLESSMMRNPGKMKSALKNLKYIIIDEFHAFIAEERGVHLISLLNRIDHLVGLMDTPIPRIALSATLGEVEKIPSMLRPNTSIPCTILKDSAGSSLKMTISGYRNPSKLHDLLSQEHAGDKICADIYNLCRGGSHLVFANKRNKVEALSASLTDLCDKESVPNEFFPHHGSLSKEMRGNIESRLQKEAIPTTAICTMTLELGIDIGKVNSVIQVDAPNSVSSLRQRMGRSGRRGGPSVLRIMISENEIDHTQSVTSNLRFNLIQTIAVTRLMIQKKWYEPPISGLFHFSTFAHQVLSVIAQWGSIRADQIYLLLCKNGPFKNIEPQHLSLILKSMGEKNIIDQLASGELVIGGAGDYIVGHRSFCSVFKGEDEYKIMDGIEVVGYLEEMALPASSDIIIFGGRRWKIIRIDEKSMTVFVKKTKGGKPPIFKGRMGLVHDEIRKEMRKIYLSKEYRIEAGGKHIDFLDSEASDLFTEGVSYYDSVITDNFFVKDGESTLLFPWLGDRSTAAISGMLTLDGLSASGGFGVVEIKDAPIERVIESLQGWACSEKPPAEDFYDLILRPKIDKYDDIIPEDLLREGRVRSDFDISTGHRWIVDNFSDE